LPFLACYVSSVPTRNIMWLGEDRNDVLGAHRMQANKKWDISIPYHVKGEENQMPDDHYGNPKITFVHRDGMLIDEDIDKPHSSRIIYNRGTPQEYIKVHDPREETEFLKAHLNLLQVAQGYKAGELYAKLPLGEDVTLPTGLNVTGLPTLVRPLLGIRANDLLGQTGADNPQAPPGFPHRRRSRTSC